MLRLKRIEKKKRRHVKSKIVMCPVNYRKGTNKPSKVKRVKVILGYLKKIFDFGFVLVLL